MATIEVSSWAELIAATGSANSNDIKLTADIDMNDTPLTAQKNIYCASLDGQGHKIANLQPQNLTSPPTLLAFQNTGSNTECAIKNINFENVFTPTGTIFYLGNKIIFENNRVSGRCQTIFRGTSTGSGAYHHIYYNAFTMTHSNHFWTGGSGSAANWSSANIENNYIDAGISAPTNNTDRYYFNLYSGTDYGSYNSLTNNYITGHFSPYTSTGEWYLTRQNGAYVKTNCFNGYFGSTGNIYLNGNTTDVSNIYNRNRIEKEARSSGYTGVTDEQMKNAEYLRNNTNFPIE